MNSTPPERGAAAPGAYLFFDTETTGLPRNNYAPVSDLNNWPRLVQLGWAVYDKSGTELHLAESIIRPEGYLIPGDASRIHGITTETALEKGLKLSDVLLSFSGAVLPVPILVGHNVAFDEKIIGAEFYRCRLENVILRKERLCTMKLSVDYCQLPGSYGFKLPRLAELYKKLFGSDLGPAHAALKDVRATAKCFFQLQKLGVIQ